MAPALGSRSSASKMWSHAPLLSLLLLPGALTFYMAVNSGGIFPVTTACASLAVIVSMLISLVVIRGSLVPPARAVLLPAALLALLAVWTFLSSSWSHAPGRALEAFGRVSLYLLVFLLFGLVPRSVGRMRWLLRGVLLAVCMVAGLALASRLLPSVIPTAPGVEDDRLNYPITYWNTLGMILGLGCVLALHHTSDESEPKAVRVLAAVSLPPLGAALLLTFSRGAVGSTALGLLAYLVLARPRGLVGGLLATIPAVAAGLVLTEDAPLLQEGSPWNPAQIAQGHRLAIALALCSAAAGLIRTLLLPLDARLSALLPRVQRGTKAKLLWGLGGLLVLMVAAVVLNGPAHLHTQYEHFVEDRQPRAGGSSERLLSIGNDGRLPLWHVALSAYRQDPVKGSGAGTFRLDWERHQQGPYDRMYSYSVYLETLGELGWVGLALLLGAVVAIIVGLARRTGGHPVYVAAAAVMLAWVIHVGVDIDWQTPAVTIPVMAVAGAALAAPVGSRGRRSKDSIEEAGGGRWRSSFVRPLLAVLCALAAVAPAQLALAHTYSHEAVQALGSNDCRRAQADAQSAISARAASATPYIVLSMCFARAGNNHQAVNLARRSVSRDPDNWETHYVLGLVYGLARVDPQPQMRIALEDYPQSSLAKVAAVAFAKDRPGRWRGTALSLSLELEE
jgi:hypothetical protein